MPIRHHTISLWRKGFTVVERFRFPLIQTQQFAVHLTPKGHTELPARLNNLEISFQSRFQRTGYLPDISEAIQNQQRATQLTPDGHADLLVLSGVPFTSMIDHLHYRRSWKRSCLMPALHSCQHWHVRPAQAMRSFKRKQFTWQLDTGALLRLCGPYLICMLRK